MYHVEKRTVTLNKFSDLKCAYLSLVKLAVLRRNTERRFENMVYCAYLYILYFIYSISIKCNITLGLQSYSGYFDHGIIIYT